MSWLLDTNAISELSRERPDPGVIAWFQDSDEDSLYLSVAVVAELRSGIQRMPLGRKRRLHETWLVGTVLPRFDGRILTLDNDLAQLWGQCHAKLRAAGLTDIVMDALIGATALHHGLTLVTRNLGDFAPLGIPIVKPWSG